MKYIFVINGREDKAFIAEELDRQIASLEEPIEYEKYTTRGSGDGTRFVRLYCEFHPKDEICFVGCGGSGTVNEIASGLLGMGCDSSKSLAMLAWGTSNDMTKCYPELDFKSLEKIINGRTVLIDGMKCNDNYAINVLHFGFDAMAAHEANRYIEEGAKNGYSRGVLSAFLNNRFNRFHVWVDGEKISRGLTCQCLVANAQYYGGGFHCAPRAVMDDGLLEVCLVRGISALEFLKFYGYFERGEHLDTPFCQRRSVYRRGKHIEVKSRSLIYICLDGEITADFEIKIDVLEKALALRLPAA